MNDINFIHIQHQSWISGVIGVTKVDNLRAREREEKGTTNSVPELMNDGGHSLNGTLSMPDFGTFQFWYHMGNHSYTITGQFFSGHNFVQKKKHTRRKYLQPLCGVLEFDFSKTGLFKNIQYLATSSWKIIQNWCPFRVKVSLFHIS